MMIMSNRFSNVLVGCVALSWASGAVAQCLLERIIPDQIQETAIYGTSIDIDGDRMVVGAPLDYGNDWAAGALYVYQHDGRNWQLEARLIAGDGTVGDMLGVCVDMEGDRIVAGAWFEDVGLSNSGAAYVYRRDPGTGEWALEQKIVPEISMIEATFGRTVAIEGDLVAVGAPLHSGQGNASGAVYTFRLSEEKRVWTEEQLIVANNLESLDRFGLALDIDQQRLAIGASWSLDERGQAYIFRFDEGLWQQSAQLTASDGEPGDQFGFELELDGSTLAIGAYHDDGGFYQQGSVYMFTDKNGTWEQQERIDIPDPHDEAQFGTSLDMSGDSMVVGARYAGPEYSSFGPGAAYLFKRGRGGWEFSSLLGSKTAEEEAEFGWSVAIDGGHVAIGAPFQDSRSPDTGGLYVLSDSDLDGVPDQCDLDPDPDINDDGVIDGEDLGAILGSWGICDGCPADVNQDGIVDGIDLGIVLGAWTI